jgi:hypothetical protein
MRKSNYAGLKSNCAGLKKPAAADEYSERARKEADGYVMVARQDADAPPLGYVKKSTS